MRGSPARLFEGRGSPTREERDEEARRHDELPEEDTGTEREGNMTADLWGVEADADVVPDFG